MLKNDNEREIPKVEFTFIDERKSDEESKKEIEKLIKKRNEILTSMGISIPINHENKTNEVNNDYPRKSR